MSNKLISVFRIQPLYMTSMYIGAVVAIIMIAFMYFIPTVLFQYKITSCSPEGVAQGFCKNQNTWMSIVDLSMGMLAIFGSPFALGGVLAAHHRRRKIHGRNIFVSIFLSLLPFITIPAIVEVLWYEPWRPRYLPDGSTYNAYRLNALFSWQYIVSMLIAVLICYLLTMGIMALWAKLPKAGQINAIQK